MRSRKRVLGLTACLALFLAVPFTLFSFIKETKAPPLPLLGEVHPFLLKDSVGQEFHSEKNLRGKVWIAAFFFTTCSDICPVLSKNMASLSRAFEKVEGIHLVSITVNPEQDSPETLTRYAQTFQGNQKNWHFLTGPRETITQVAVGSFKLGDIQEPVFHSGSFPLVDSRGFIRGYYDGTKEKEVNRLFQDAVRLVKEAKE